MIMINKLRCGNLVYVHDHPVTVEPADIYLNIENIKPIELTEEWILELGFQKVIGGILEDYYELRRHRIELRKVGGNHNLWQIKFSNRYLPLSYGHVHEIQNTVFWLVGEDL